MTTQSNPWPPERVAALRSRLGLTLQQMAHELDVAMSSVHRWEQGRIRPSKASRKKLDEAVERINLSNEYSQNTGAKYEHYENGWKKLEAQQLREKRELFPVYPLPLTVGRTLYTTIKEPEDDD